MIEEQVDTKTRLLDAAEKLFGKNGFDATSLRDITAGAQVNLAAVNYHFQSKESLIDAIIERRLEPVNPLRIQMLAVAGPSPTGDHVVQAFLGSGWRGTAPTYWRRMILAIAVHGRLHVAYFVPFRGVSSHEWATLGH